MLESRIIQGIISSILHANSNLSRRLRSDPSVGRFVVPFCGLDLTPVLEMLKRSPLEVENPPSGTYDEVLPSPRLWSSTRWTRRQLLAEKHATHSIIRMTDFPHKRKRNTQRARECGEKTMQDERKHTTNVHDKSDDRYSGCENLPKRIEESRLKNNKNVSFFFFNTIVMYLAM